MKKGAGNGATRSPVWIINKLCGDLLFLPPHQYPRLTVSLKWKGSLLAPFNLISAVLAGHVSSLAIRAGESWSFERTEPRSQSGYLSVSRHKSGTAEVGKCRWESCK